MKFVTQKTKRNQGIHIQQIPHGKLARISSTSLLVKVGAFGPALKTGRPVIGSVTILSRCVLFWRGVNTIFPFSISASSGSPARMSSRRRRAPGRTTCPFVETLVCMVRQSYRCSVVQASNIEARGIRISCKNSKKIPIIRNLPHSMCTPPKTNFGLPRPPRLRYSELSSPAIL